MKKVTTFEDIRINLYFLSGLEFHSGKGAKVVSSNRINFIDNI